MPKEIYRDTATDLGEQSPQPPTTEDLRKSIQEKFERDTLPALLRNERWRRDSMNVKWEPSLK